MEPKPGPSRISLSSAPISPRSSPQKSPSPSPEKFHSPTPEIPKSRSEKLKGKIKTYLVMPWDKPLICFATVIWTWEIVKAAMDALGENQLRQTMKLTDQTRLRQYLMVPVLFVFIGMCATGVAIHLLLTDKFPLPSSTKYYFLIVGLAAQVAWTAVSVIIIFANHVFAGLMLHWTAVPWNLVYPIRFLLIFHQKFPLIYLHSHMLTSFNEGMILLARYFFTVFLTESENLTYISYMISWIVILVCGVAWTLGVYSVKRYRNPIPQNLEKVRKVYEQENTVVAFNKRQTPKSRWIFKAILVPGVVLAFTRTAITILLRQMALEAGDKLVLGMHDYRADIVIAMLTMIIIECIVIFVRKYRTINFDLVVIGIAHFLCLIVLIVIAVLIEGVSDIVNKTPRRGYSLVEIYLSEGVSNTAGFIFKENDVEYSNEFMAKLTQRQKQVSKDGETVSFQIFTRPHGDVVSDTEILLEPGKFQLFHTVQDGPLAKITMPNKYLPEYQYDPQVYVLNSIRECSDYDAELGSYLGMNMSNIRGVLFTGGVCAPVEVSFHVLKNFTKDKDYSQLKAYEIADVVKVSPPGFEGVSPYFTIPCQHLPSKNNEYSCVTVFQGYYKMFEYYSNIGKPFPSPQRQAFRLLQLKPYTIHPVRLDYQPRPYDLINILSESTLKNVGELGLAEMCVPMLFHGVTTGIGVVSYVHFIWRQVPIVHQVLIIYGFFSSVYAVIWIAPFVNSYHQLSTLAALIVLCLLQVLALAWHITFAIWFFRNMKESDDDFVSASSVPLEPIEKKNS